VFDAKPPFGAAKRDINHRALESHQRGKGLYLILVDLKRVTDSALGWQVVFTVRRPPPLEDLMLTINFDLKAHLVNRTAFPEKLSDSRRQIHSADRGIEHLFDIVHEAGMIGND